MPDIIWTIVIVLLVLWLASALLGAIGNGGGWNYGPPAFQGSNIVYIILVIALLYWAFGRGPRRCEAPLPEQRTAHVLVASHDCAVDAGVRLRAWNWA